MTYCKPLFTSADEVAVNSNLENLCAWIEDSAFRLEHVTYRKPLFTSADEVAVNSDLQNLRAWIEDSAFRLELRKTFMLITRKRHPQW
jgi:hypothetical protein